ncbi:MAG TPA: beta-ketoacyl-ACP reductase [Rhodospirillaceae bacterium]|jgi:acetoacetyl-CoA reductase|nr:acetoacetyl-CoA reductase [Alphaproteobacteria bacterium]HBH26785.1 beta-ketoacyl-ACP reductase [Rhodospirillaceae bacterium]
MNKVAIVTGGTRGIGLAISHALMKAGTKVAALYHGNEEAAEAFRKEGGMALKADVGNFSACEAAVAEVEKALGPVDVLVNNAGITRDGFLHKMSEENWKAVIEANLNSLFNMSKAVVTGMRDRKYGRIVNISSINGQKGQLGQTNYSAAKAGVIGFTKALAAEGAAKGITVNVVCPGYIATDMTKAMPEKVLESIVAGIPVGRMGEPEEIADLVAFLASPGAGFITGATFAANGGQYMT